MEINKHVCFRCEDAPELVKYVLNNHISSVDIDETFCAFDIYESSPHWEYISSVLQAKKISVCYSETHFSKEELNAAKWLQVRSQWRNGYPQPQAGFEYENITYTRKDHCEECGTGLKQVDSFRIKKAPNWGKRHFMMLNWVEDELFVSTVAKEILQREGYASISFREVKNRNGREVLQDIYQLVISATIAPGIIDNQSCFRDIHICPKCGNKRYHPNGIGMYKFRKEVFENAPDIVKTTDETGWGKGSSPLIIFSQRVYQTIVENHLDRGLVFEPIELV